MSDPDARLVRALKQLGAEHEPPPGWQARVLAAIEPAPRRRPWWWFAIPAAALAAGAVLLWAWPSPEPLTLVVERSPSAQHMRSGGGSGGSIHILAPGEPIRAVARGGGRHHAIRVYRDGRELVAACPGPVGGHRAVRHACGSSGGAWTLELAPSGTGTYQVVAWSSSVDVPAPGGTYAGDFAAATATGATRKEQEIEVR